jgi:hypothetical protein
LAPCSRLWPNGGSRPNLPLSTPPFLLSSTLLRLFESAAITADSPEGGSKFNRRWGVKIQTALTTVRCNKDIFEPDHTGPLRTVSPDSPASAARRTARGPWSRLAIARWDADGAVPSGTAKDVLKSGNQKLVLRGDPQAKVRALSDVCAQTRFNGPSTSREDGIVPTVAHDSSLHPNMVHFITLPVRPKRRFSRLPIVLQCCL